MNAKETINKIEFLGDHLMKMANHPAFYNSAGAHYLAIAAQTLYQEGANLRSIEQEWGFPQLDMGEVIDVI